MYIAAPSTSYCSRSLAATDATYSHKVAPQPQPTSTKDLCGCCDKLWSLEHKCKKETPLMIAPTEESKLEDTTLEPKEKDTPQLATHTVPTLASYTNLQTLKIEGFLEQQSVIILIDAESTQTSWVIRLLLPT
ncbi:hypothetical protein GW17_00054513 [Ensete ventricosum]|nr:hypothetical protein GW17_00054513 [Ensete ventricosum]RZR81900.1 hypothetical protein BHM03_00008206 [Ensete ventricosum]